MSSSVRRTILASLAIVTTLVGLAVAPDAHAALGQNPCNSTDPGLMLEGCDPNSGSTTTPTPTPTPTTSTPAPSASPTASPKASTNAEEWAQGTAEGTGKIAGTLKESYQTPTKVALSSNTIVAYAFTWAIGMVILAIALMVSVARAARTTPQSRAEATIQAQKVLLYYPGMMMIPAVVKLAVDTAMGVAEGITAQSGASFSGFLDSFGSVMTQDPLSLVTGVLGGGVAALLLLLPTLLFMLMWLVMDIAAQFGAQLLMILLPITFALGMFPNAFKRWSGRATGFLLGCILTPVVTRFVFWVMWSIAGDMLQNVSQNIFHALLIIFVVITIGTSAPIGLAYVMPMVLDRSSGVYGGGGGSSVRPGQELVDKITNGVQQRFTGSGGGNSILDKGTADEAGSTAVAQAKGAGSAGGATAGSTAGGATAGGGSAAGGAAGGAAAGGIAAAGALGVLGAAVLAAQQGGEALGAAAKNTASMQLQAGGGHTNDTSTGAPRIGGGHGGSYRGGTGPSGYQTVNEAGAVSSGDGYIDGAPDDSGVYVPDMTESDWTPSADYMNDMETHIGGSWSSDISAPSSPVYLEPEDVAPIQPERVVPIGPERLQPAVPPVAPQGTVRLTPPRSHPGPKYTPPPPRNP